MAEPIRVQPYGDMLKIVMHDTSSRLAYPTGGNLWVVARHPSAIGAEPRHVQPYGDLLKILMSDASSRIGIPAGGNLFYVNPRDFEPPIEPPIDPPIDPPEGPRFIWPFGLQWVTSEFGWRVLNGQSNLHNGIDFQPGGSSAAADGQPIIAVGDGTVYERYTSGQLGNAIRIDHGTVGGHNVRTGYGHMKFAPLVADNQVVAKGQVIGYVGQTGISFGSHLHLETWDNGTRINPRNWMNAYANQ